MNQYNNLRTGAGAGTESGTTTETSTETEKRIKKIKKKSNLKQKKVLISKKELNTNKTNNNLNNKSNNNSKFKMVAWNKKDAENNSCFGLFNPEDKEGYDFLTSNWSGALVGLINNVYAKKETVPKFRK